MAAGFPHPCSTSCNAFVCFTSNAARGMFMYVSLMDPRPRHLIMAIPASRRTSSPLVACSGHVCAGLALALVSLVVVPSVLLVDYYVKRIQSPIYEVGDGGRGLRSFTKRCPCSA